MIMKKRSGITSLLLSTLMIASMLTPVFMTTEDVYAFNQETVYLDTECIDGDVSENIDTYQPDNGGAEERYVVEDTKFDADGDGEDTDKTVEAYANGENGDVTKVAGNVAPTNKISGDAYGIKASAQNDKTATVTAKDIDVNIPSADFEYGIKTLAGDDFDDPKSSGHVVISCGNVTSHNDGIYAEAIEKSDITVTVNGSVESGAHDGIYGTGVYASAKTGSVTKVIVNGNVTAKGTGVNVNAQQELEQEKATTLIEVKGDVTATANKAGESEGVVFNGRWDAYDVLVEGTIKGEKYGVVTDVAYYYTPGTNKLTAWKVTSESGSADNMFVKLVDLKKYEVDDISAKNANYIIRSADNVKILKPDGTDLDKSHNYPVAKEGDKVLITAANGKVVTKAYNNGEEITTKDARGFFYVEVPRGGGIDLSADIGDTPAPPVEPTKVAVPAGKTLTYNGRMQTGVDGGTGYTLSGTTSAINAGSYQATATLQNGYIWSDGTRAAKTINWKINKADVSVTPPDGKLCTYNGKEQTGVAAGDGYTLSGTVSAVNAGDYSAKATLVNDPNRTYKWSDGTSAAKTISWKIDKAENTMTAVAAKATFSVKYNAGKAVTTVQTLNVNDAEGKVAYSNASTDTTAKKFSVDAENSKITIPKATKAGTYEVQVNITAAGDNNYKPDSKTVSFKITVNKVANPLNIKAKKSSNKITYSAKKAQVLKARNAYTIKKKGQGKVTYTLTSAVNKKKQNVKSKFKVAKSTGNITLTKGLEKSTYTVKVKVKAAGNKNYKSATKTVKLKIVVK